MTRSGWGSGVVVAVAMATLGACASEPAEPSVGPNETIVDADLTRPFQLRAGEIAKLDDGLLIAFRRVSNDSRCPMDAVCVWTGDATVHLDVTVGRMAWNAAEVHTHVSPKAASFRDYEIRLVELAPYPQASQPIPAGEYIAKLEVTRRP
jgi:hypothetical protein